jgi:hypothetical protein
MRINNETYIPHTFSKNVDLYNPLIYLKWYQHTADRAPF